MSKEHLFSNDEITIIWKKELCTHSTICWKGLNSVFQPGQRPWIKPDGAPTEAIIAQVLRCPSGALSLSTLQAAQQKEAPTRTPVSLVENGPLLINGPITVVHGDGREEERDGPSAFCRCGGTRNHPYCDGSHRKLQQREP